MPLLHERLAQARRALVEAGLDHDEAAIDVEVLARHALGWDRARLLTELREPAPVSLDPAFAELVQRRISREPVAYIVGHREFWEREFDVTPDVLIPRPETEIIIEEALDDARGRAIGRIVDVGTGSGCLAVTLALELPAAEITATDVSEAAIAVARRNAARYAVGHRMRFVVGDLLEDVTGVADLIVSNPPYVQPESHLAPEVQRYEPHRALFGGGDDGLDTIRRLLASAAPHLAPGGLLVVEFGFGQDAGVREAAAAAGWQVVRIRADLQGIPRTAVLRR